MAVVCAFFQNPKRRQQGHFGRAFPARWSGDDKTAPPSLMRAGLDLCSGRPGAGD